MSLIAAFWILATLVIFFTIVMLFSDNFVHSAVALAAVLISFAGLYLLLNAEFLAVMQIFIYAGAITVLIIFVVMMTKTRAGSVREIFSSQTPVAVVVAFLAGALMLNVMTAIPVPSIALGKPNTELLAKLLFTRYLFPFELASLVLLAATIGAIYLAKGEDE